MKNPDMTEMIATVQMSHEIQATINDLDKLYAYVNSIIASKSLTKIRLVQDNDTLRSLALKYYGDQSYWVSLGKYNGLTNGTLTKGTELIIPDKDELDTWLETQEY